jgi:hypothetical protein
MNEHTGRANGTGSGFTYRLFGLAVASEISLLQGEQEIGAPDVVISLTELGGAAPGTREGGPLVSSAPGFARFHWPEIGWVEVRDGVRIMVEPAQGASPEIVSHIVQGIGMATLLDQRGIFTLHASAVAIDGSAVGFLGWKGHGKSTLCATLYRRGHGFVTDDVLALIRAGAGMSVLPGTAQLKLYPDSLEASLGETAEALPQIWSLSPKRFRHVTDGVVDPQPLGAIYVLSFGGPGHEKVTIEPIPPHEACIELIRHSYALRFFGESGATPEHLAQCAAVAKQVPIRRIVRPPAVSSVHESAEALERDVRSRLAVADPVTPSAAGALTGS